MCAWCRESATDAEKADKCLRFWCEGITKFKNLRGKDGKLQKHHTNKLHHIIVERRANLEKARECGSLEQQLIARPNSESEKMFNRRQLEKLASILVRAIHLNLPHSDCLADSVAFQVTCMGDLELAKFCKPGVRSNSSYTSKETIGQLLRALSDVIERPTIEAIRASPFTVIQADGTTDSAGVEQFVIAMRYWNKHAVHERFCSLRNLSAGTAEYLESIMCEFFATKGIDIEKLIFQVWHFSDIV